MFLAKGPLSAPARTKRRVSVHPHFWTALSSGMAILPLSPNPFPGNFLEPVQHTASLPLEHFSPEQIRCPRRGTGFLWLLLFLGYTLPIPSAPVGPNFLLSQSLLPSRLQVTHPVETEKHHVHSLQRAGLTAQPTETDEDNWTRPWAHMLVTTYHRFPVQLLTKLTFPNLSENGATIIANCDAVFSLSCLSEPHCPPPLAPSSCSAVPQRSWRMVPWCPPQGLLACYLSGS